MSRLKYEDNYDWPHLTATLVLCFFGLTMLYSASSVIAYDQFGDSFFFLKKQSLIFFSSLVVLFIFSKIDYEYLLKHYKILLILSAALMIAPLLPQLGHSAGGGARWIDLGLLKFQPSEWAKVCCILFLSRYLCQNEKIITNFKKGFLPPILICIVFAGLCLAQPDLGNACLIVSLALLSLYLSGTKTRYLFYSILCFSLPLLVLMFSSPYRMRRLTSFWRPWADPNDTSYQIIQSFMALSNGGITGRGVGNSQGKLYYLPEAQTDFIASIIGEELGLIGLSLLTLTFLYFLLQTFKIARNSKRKSGFYLASLAGILLGLEIFGNLFVVSGLVPTKGLPLPFLSQGGSSLLCSLICCGIIQSIAQYGNRASILKNER